MFIGKNIKGIEQMPDNNLSHDIILASASPRRVDLLAQIGVTPKDVFPADIDETPNKKELPHQLAMRLSQEKALAIHAQRPKDYILAADTVVACGKNILDKALTADQAAAFLARLQGRRHHVYGGITIVTPQGDLLTKNCKTMVQFRPLNKQQIIDYIDLGEWHGKAGGYAIQGYAGCFVKRLSGSYSNVVGLSLYDTMTLLQRVGNAK